MLYVPYVSCVQFTLAWSKKPESLLFPGNFSLVVIEPVEVEELAKYRAIYWWIVGVLDGFS